MLSAAKINGIHGGGVGSSLRLKSNSSAYLSRTPSVVSNRTTWTWSAWVKLGLNNLSSSPAIFQAGYNTAPWTVLLQNTDGSLQIAYSAGSAVGTNTNAVLKDPSAWYHLVWVTDTTQATASNRMKFYINGVQASFSSTNYPAQNFATPVNNTVAHTLGGWSSQYFDGYLAEVNFIDGQALTASSFGAFSATTGVWQPIKYSGTYGTNGFYLPFSQGSGTYADYYNGSSQYLSLPRSTSSLYLTGAFTFECWFKPSSLTSQGILYGNWANQNIYTDGGNAWAFFFAPGSANIYGFNFLWYRGTYGSNQTMIGGSYTFTTNQWYHLAVVRDSSNNIYLFVNGTALSLSTYNDTITWDNTYSFTCPSSIGIGGTSPYLGLNGYQSNVRFVSGTALYTSNFAPPIAPLTAISGTQLLTLQNSSIVDNSSNAITITNNGSVATSAQTNVFVNPSSLAADRSGNGNNFTPYNISAQIGSTYDSMLDYPKLISSTVSNYCLLNWNDSDTGGVMSNGNLAFATGASVWHSTRSTFFMPSGKWYWEVYVYSGTQLTIGISTNSASLNSAYVGQDANGYSYYTGTGTKNTNGVGTAYGASCTTGDTVGVAYDATAGTLTFYKNNVSQGVAYSGLTGSFSPALGVYASTGTINFGQQGFTYTPPSGYNALNTYNLPTPTIVQGNKYMDATIYTGNGGTNAIMNSGSFQPDLVWYKSRSSGYDNSLFDSVRGATKQLVSNSTATETTLSGVSAFNTNGFTLSTDANGNNTNSTYVAWQWQANKGSTSSNTSGSITSTISVNTTAGFSIVTYTGTGSNSTVGHGLGVAPSMVMVKKRSSTGNWPVYHIGLTSASYDILLNTTGGQNSASAVWNNTAPTSSVFSIGTDSDVNASSSTYVAYCFAPITGFSAFGSYVGNNSSTGPFVYLGFNPKFVLIRYAGSSGGVNWEVYDSARDTYNSVTHNLSPNLSSAEATSYSLSFLSNGFQITSTTSNLNDSGVTYIYAAFASNPFNYSNAF